jgi:ATP-dependent helicase HepA
VRPSDQLRVSNIPGLSEDGMTITANRELALAREDLKFLTWEHPMVTGAMELVLSTETGNAVVSVIHHPELKAGQFLLECLFIIECSAPAELQIGRFLPPTPIRVLINQHKVDLTLTFPHSSLIETGKNFDKDQIVSFLNNQRTLITQLITEAEKKAKDEMQELIESATNTMLTSLAVEIKRLIRLKKVNPTIKEEEIEQLKDMTMLAHENIQAAHLRLDAVRFVITS